jgi:hypothetical protein
MFVSDIQNTDKGQLGIDQPVSLFSLNENVLFFCLL